MKEYTYKYATINKFGIETILVFLLVDGRAIDTRSFLGYGDDNTNKAIAKHKATKMYKDSFKEVAQPTNIINYKQFG